MIILSDFVLIYYEDIECSFVVHCRIIATSRTVCTKPNAHFFNTLKPYLTKLPTTLWLNIVKTNKLTKQKIY